MEDETKIEKLFWQIYRNVTLNKKIFQSLVWDRNDNLNRDYYRYNFIENQIKFKYINSMEWMVKRGEFQLLLCKIKANEYISMVNKSSMGEFIQRFNKHVDNQILQELFNRFRGEEKYNKILIEVFNNKKDNLLGFCINNNFEHLFSYLVNKPLSIKITKDNLSSLILKESFIKIVIKLYIKNKNFGSIKKSKIKKIKENFQGSVVHKLIDYYCVLKEGESGNEDIEQKIDELEACEVTTTDTKLNSNALVEGFRDCKGCEVSLFAEAILKCDIGVFQFLLDSFPFIKLVKINKDLYDTLIDQSGNVFFTTGYSETSLLNALEFWIKQFKERDSTYKLLCNRMVDFYFGTFIGLKDAKIESLIKYYKLLAANGLKSRHITYHSFHYLRLKSIRLFKYLMQRPYFYRIRIRYTHSIKSFPNIDTHIPDSNQYIYEGDYREIVRCVEAGDSCDLNIKIAKITDFSNFQECENDGYENLKEKVYDFRRYFKPSKYTIDFIMDTSEDQLLESLREDVSYKPTEKMAYSYPRYQSISHLHDFKFYLETNRQDIFFTQLKLLQGRKSIDSLISIYQFLIDGDEIYQEEEDCVNDRNLPHKPQWAIQNYGLSLVAMIIRAMDIHSIDAIIEICSEIQKDLIKRFYYESIKESRLDVLDHIVSKYYNKENLIIHIEYLNIDLFQNSNPKNIPPLNNHHFIINYLKEKNILLFKTKKIKNKY
ncbi:hypothetical protein DICPUDRAFT_76963 [Dictyostelium purpureum]|uniref:Uncharacterized protein n=1 Tax=Dictyostelium purpureum TaxID=5786 RepID=F0ZF70_DICPU|nr:uncharacterized protein DICPUDRAFT_76963 [Dictyostelium purpureum]EGC37424.1 hypothetical protein DICPUDRAFT_76963 [Dictyostelium purpureum]|eukprot:XP_003286077.1 hypothetical protein DICPUDRAFT_76963 [Dictyostelium purpureum]